MISFPSVVLLVVALAGQGQSWPTFNEFKYWVSLYAPRKSIRLRTDTCSGDSYTQTGFNVSLTQPSLSNPMGNPPFPGWTSSKLVHRIAKY
jgi:hypothetical protein